MTISNDLMAQPLYSTAELAHATGVPAETIRTWFKRNILNFSQAGMGEDVERVGLGRRYSANTALLVAIMGRLTAGGMVAADARHAASHFVFASVDERDPGCLYFTGQTILAIAKDFPGGMQVKVAHQTDEAIDYYALFDGKADHIETLRLDNLWYAVVEALDLRERLEP